MNWIKTILFVLLISLSSIVDAQRVTAIHFKVVPPEGCIGSEDKKAQKLLDTGKDRKTDKEDRVESLRKAVDVDPECAEAHYLLGLELLKTSVSNGASFKTAEFELSEAVRICPEYHFYPYYFLGAITLGKKDYAAAVKYYDKYFEISGSHMDPLDDEIEAEIKLDYEFAKFFADAYANPVPYSPIPVSGISTSMDEFLPLISPDNEHILITRRYKDESEVRQTSFTTASETYTEKFVEADRTANGFTEGKPLPSPFNINPSWHYGGATVSLDNKHLFLTICKPSGGGRNNCDIYSCDLKYGYNPRNGQTEYYWSALENLGDSVNTEDGWEAQPSISADGQTLYFASAREGSQGIDIYYAKRQKDGSWAGVKSIGEPINTAFNDKTPFMHSDSKTLYFASDGHLGFGGYDVYLSRQNDDGSWCKPMNIGHPINTEQDEQAFAVSTDGKRVYYSAKDPQKPESIDVFNFELYKEARPEQVLFVKGTLKDESGKVPENAVVELKTMDSKNVTRVDVDMSDGGYAAVVRIKQNENVVMNVKAKEIAFNSKLIETKPLTVGVRVSEEESDKSLMQSIDFEVAPIEAGGVYKINDIYYSSNSAEISNKSKMILDEFAEYLKEHSTIRISIQGHTDNVGNESVNLALSADRAFSVKSYIESKGVEGTRIEYKGFGSSKPSATNDTADGRSQNRRTEFVVLSK